MHEASDLHAEKKRHVATVLKLQQRAAAAAKVLADHQRIGSENQSSYNITDPEAVRAIRTIISVGLSLHDEAIRHGRRASRVRTALRKALGLGLLPTKKRL